MTRPFLFGGTASSQSQNKYLVEFRAGKMSMKGKTVTPDIRKGLVYLNQTDDSLMHFCWKDRKSGNVEDDLIIFPDDVEFKKVSQCTTGRVFVLKFKSSSRRCFYWMQEPKLDKDDEYCNKINEYLNNPPLPGSNRGPSTPAQSLQADLSSIGEGELQNLINNMSQQQLMQLLGGVGGLGGSVANLSNLLSGTNRSSSGASERTTAAETPTTPTPQVTTTAPPATPTPAPTPVVAPAPSPASVPATPSSRQGPTIQLSDLQTILSGISVPPGASTTTGDKPSVDLSSAVTLEVLQPLIQNKELMDRLQALLPPTTEATPSSEQFRSTVQSPQFQQALSMFSMALQSGQLGPLMQQFGMAETVIEAANSGDMENFVKALQASQNASKKDEEKQ